MPERVLVEICNGVADVRLNRPDKLNALDREMFEEINHVIARIGQDKSIRVVTLSGEGRGFCAGIDISSLETAIDEKDLLSRSHGEANLYQNAAWGWRILPQPVIAAVHGVAYGAGLQIALGADIRIATADARLSIMEGRWGLVPDVAAFALLKGLVRSDVVRELTYSARIISGEEGQRLGLVTRIAEDACAAVRDLARQIAERHPAAIRAAKRLTNLMPAAASAEMLKAESQEQVELLSSKGHEEAKRAVANRRKPNFVD